MVEALLLSHWPTSQFDLGSQVSDATPRRGPVPPTVWSAMVTTKGSGAAAAPRRASTMAATRVTLSGWGCWRYHRAAAADASGSAGQVSQDQGRAGREHGACIRAQQRWEARRAQSWRQDITCEVRGGSCNRGNKAEDLIPRTLAGSNRQTWWKLWTSSSSSSQLFDFRLLDSLADKLHDALKLRCSAR